MVRMKLSKEEFDPKKLDIPQQESTFKRYRGEIPKNGTILIFRVTKMWWTQSKSGDSQIYLMAFAEQNNGPLKQYNGLPIREYLTFNADNAFRYMPFLNNFGLTTRDIYNKMDVEREPDKIGDIITAIGDWVVGSDDALCRIAVVRDHYDPDETKAKVDIDGWMPLDDEDEVDADEDADADDDEEDEEDDEPPARPTRAVKSATSSKRGAVATRRGRPEPEDEDDEDIDDDEDEDDDIDDEAEAEEDEAAEEGQEDEGEDDEEPPARTSRRTRTAASTRPAARSGGNRRGATAPASDGSRTRSGARTSSTRTASKRDRGSADDPPF